MMLLLLCMSGLSLMGHLVDASMSYLSGDAMIDITQPGPDGEPYPSNLIDDLYHKGIIGPIGGRRGRTLHHTMDPMVTRDTLLKQYKAINQGGHKMLKPTGRSINDGDSMAENLVKAGASVKSSSSRVSTSTSFSMSEGASQTSCPQGPPARLCKTRYNTTAPMYGVSLTSGNPVTIVQKFPDLLQQVIFEVCETDTCDVVQGSCVQTYVPYLFLVIPLGPVTLTGQDYVLVESGCVCQPKYAAPSSAPSPIDALQG